jgi:glycosyltransferase 2 family protein
MRRPLWRPAMFVSRTDEPRARRAGDQGLLVFGLVGLIFLLLVAVPPSGFEETIIGIVAAFPAGLDWLWNLFGRLLTLTALILVIASVWQRRWQVLRDVGVGLLIAFGIMLVIDWIMPDEWSQWALLVAPVTVVKVANPHLTRPLRVLGWWAIVLGLLGAVMSQAVAPSAGASGVLIGLTAAALVAIIYGSPKGRPDVETVRTALTELGIDVSELGVADRQAEGVFVLEAHSKEEGPLEVKVYGRDAYDTQLLTTVWRTVWFRGSGAPTTPGRLQQVEHEALLTLLARHKGVPTPGVVTAGEVGNGDALLVLERTGTPIGTVGWDERRVAQLFETLERLRSARVTHGQIDEEHLVVINDTVGLIDFRGGRVTTDPWWIRKDEVQAVVTAVLALGVERGLEASLHGLGSEELGEILPFLQKDVLTPALLAGLETSEIDVDELRAAVAGVAGVEAPELVRLRRITVGSLIAVVLPVLAFFALASIFAGLDFEALATTLADASWWMVFIGLVIAQFPRFTQAITALGASPNPIPLGPLFRLQLAQTYIALTIPTSAARVALNTRFFQRHGLNTGTALIVGAIDGFSGFVCQVILLILILVLIPTDLEIDFSAATSSGVLRLVLIVVVVCVVAAILVMVIPKTRRLIIDRGRTLLRDGGGAFSSLHSPRRLAMLLGGGIASEILFAMALGAMVLALGYSVSLPELLLINILVSLLSGVLPIPGGIGVVEGGILLGLTRVGIPEEAAFAMAILYRAATFYLPPIWGALAFRSLQKDGHL